MSPAFEKMIAVIRDRGGALCTATVPGNKGTMLATPDLKPDHTKIVARQIVCAGRKDVGPDCNVLNEGSPVAAGTKFSDSLVLCDSQMKGTGANHSSCTALGSFLFEKDPHANKAPKTFFGFVPEGGRFSFDLNFFGSLLPTLSFVKERVGRPGTSPIIISFTNAFRTLN